MKGGKRAIKKAQPFGFAIAVIKPCIAKLLFENAKRTLSCES